jgi:hypothetical protein
MQRKEAKTMKKDKEWEDLPDKLDRSLEKSRKFGKTVIEMREAMEQFRRGELELPEIDRGKVPSIMPKLGEKK